jgi:hypothetical protein
MNGPPIEASEIGVGDSVVHRFRPARLQIMTKAKSVADLSFPIRPMEESSFAPSGRLFEAGQG